MILLSDQSKVIGSLQKTIDVLNATIKGLNMQEIVLAVTFHYNQKTITIYTHQYIFWYLTLNLYFLNVN